MRNPGYMSAERVWDFDCDVLFNDIDFGKNLIYRSFEFTPAKPKKNETNIAGMPGRMDYSHLPGGYLVHDNAQGKLELWVRDAAAWGDPTGQPGFVSPEARFLATVHGQVCKIEFSSSNGFYLRGKCEITRYDRFKLGFLIVIKIDAEPYWLETGVRSVEWNLNDASPYNLFNPSSAVLNTELLPVGQSCVWDVILGVGRYTLHAEPGNYAEVRVGGLSPGLRYRYYCRNIFNHGLWEAYDGNGIRIRSNPVTGVNAIVFRLISKASAVLPVGFIDFLVCEAGAGSESGVIETLDAPLRTLVYSASAPCTMVLGTEAMKLSAGENVPIYGLNIPPRTSVPVTVYSELACSGYIDYQRGALMCTL